MRFAVALLLAGGASAYLTPRQDVPTCALACISSANAGDCAVTDNTCLCNNADFVSSVTTCIQSTCSSADQAAAESFAQSSCAAVGVTLTATGSSTGSGSSSTSTSASGSGSSTSTSTSSSSSSSSTSGAQSLQVPGAAAFALGLAAFVL